MANISPSTLSNTGPSPQQQYVPSAPVASGASTNGTMGQDQIQVSGNVVPGGSPPNSGSNTGTIVAWTLGAAGVAAAGGAAVYFLRDGKKNESEKNVNREETPSLESSTRERSGAPILGEQKPSRQNQGHLAAGQLGRNSANRNGSSQRALGNQSRAEIENASVVDADEIESESESEKENDRKRRKTGPSNFAKGAESTRRESGRTRIFSEKEAPSSIEDSSDGSETEHQETQSSNGERYQVEDPIVGSLLRKNTTLPVVEPARNQPPGEVNGRGVLSPIVNGAERPEKKKPAEHRRPSAEIPSGNNLLETQPSSGIHLSDSNGVDRVSAEEPKKVGKVHYLRQHHSMDFTDIRPELKDNDKYAVAISQQYCLDVFIEHKAKLILPESHYGNDPNDAAAYIKTMARFSTYQPGQILNEKQIDALHDYGAHRVYKHLRSRPVKYVVFHDSVTEKVQRKAVETARKTLRIADENLAVPYDKYQEYERDCLTARNYDCKNAIQRVMKEFPGEDVFVMMGSSKRHDEILDFLRDDDEHIDIQEHEVPKPILR